MGDQNALTEPVAITAGEMRLRRLAAHLQMAGEMGHAAILLVVYRSEFVRAEVEQALATNLEEAGETIVRLRVQPDSPTIDIPRFVQQHPQRDRAIFFVYNLQAGGEAALQFLNYRRELLAAAGERLLFWLTESEFARLARQAPDFFAFRGRTVEFLEPPTRAQLQTLAKDFSAHAGWRDFTNQAEMEDAIALRRSLLADLPEEPQFERQRADLQDSLGRLLVEIGRYEEARPLLEKALAIHERILGPDHSDTASSLNNMGTLLYVMGDYAAARPFFERALTISEASLGSDHPDTALSLNNLGALLKSVGDYDTARSYYERALAIREAVLGPVHPDTGQSLNNLGALLHTMGDYAAAHPYYERALVICEEVLGPDHPDTASNLNNLGALLHDMGDYAAARPYIRQALAIFEEKLGTDHPHTKTVRRNLQSLSS